jgi:hypothetical protein
MKISIKYKLKKTINFWRDRIIQILINKQYKKIANNNILLSSLTYWRKRKIILGFSKIGLNSYKYKVLRKSILLWRTRLKEIMNEIEYSDAVIMVSNPVLPPFESRRKSIQIDNESFLGNNVPKVYRNGIIPSKLRSRSISPENRRPNWSYLFKESKNDICDNVDVVPVLFTNEPFVINNSNNIDAIQDDILDIATDSNIVIDTNSDDSSVIHLIHHLLSTAIKKWKNKMKFLILSKQQQMNLLYKEQYHTICRNIFKEIGINNTNEISLCYHYDARRLIRNWQNYSQRRRCLRLYVLNFTSIKDEIKVESYFNFWRSYKNKEKVCKKSFKMLLKRKELVNLHLYLHNWRRIQLLRLHKRSVGHILISCLRNKLNNCFIEYSFRKWKLLNIQIKLSNNIKTLWRGFHTRYIKYSQRFIYLKQFKMKISKIIKFRKKQFKKKIFHVIQLHSNISQSQAAIDSRTSLLSRHFHIFISKTNWHCKKYMEIASNWYYYYKLNPIMKRWIKYSKIEHLSSVKLIAVFRQREYVILKSSLNKLRRYAYGCYLELNQRYKVDGIKDMRIMYRGFKKLLYVTSNQILIKTKCYHSLLQLGVNFIIKLQGKVRYRYFYIKKMNYFNQFSNKKSLLRYMRKFISLLIDKYDRKKCHKKKLRRCLSYWKDLLIDSINAKHMEVKAFRKHNRYQLFKAIDAVMTFNYLRKKRLMCFTPIFRDIRRYKMKKALDILYTNRVYHIRSRWSTYCVKRLR